MRTPRGGRAAEAVSADPGVISTRAPFDRLAAKPHLTATAAQTVGAEGRDGFAIAIVA